MSNGNVFQFSAMFGTQSQSPTSPSPSVGSSQEAPLPLFKYNLDVTTTVSQHQHPAPQNDNKTSDSTVDAPAAASTSITVLNSKKIYLMDRCKYYNLTMDKLIDPNYSREEEEDARNDNDAKYFARVRLGIPDEKLRKLELELVKNWALQHRGERMIELQPEEELVELEKEPQSSSKDRSKSTKKKHRKDECADCKRKSQVHRGRKQEPLPPKKETAISSVTDQMARNLAHDAYLNQCIVLLDFTPENDYDTSVEQIISFRLNCVSSQFPEEHRSKLAIIIETYSYEVSNTGVTNRRVDLTYFPVTIFWPGGSQHRTQQGQFSLLKDEKLEQLHDSIQPTPLHLPQSYWTTISGKGYFGCVLDAPTTYGRKESDLSWTYLDCGQPYTLRMKNLNFVPGAHPVKLRTVIRVNLNSGTETEEFASWPLINPGLGPMLDVDYGQSVLSMDPPIVVLDITRPSTGNSLSLLWIVSRKTEEEVKLALKCNFLSTHFLTGKANYHRYVGQPLNLTVETFNDSFEGQSRKIDSASCMIIVLEPGQSRKQMNLDYDRFCVKDHDEQENQKDPKNQKEERGRSPSSTPPSSPVPVATYSFQPSYSSTLLRTNDDLMIVPLDYHPLFLHHFDVPHFRESLNAFLQKWLPPNGSNEREPLGDILVVGLPEQNVKYSQFGMILTAELISTKLKSKSIYQCVFYKDSQTRRGETDVKLIFQGDNM